MNNVKRFRLLDTVLFVAALIALLSISLTLGFLDWQSHQSSNRSLLLAIAFLIIAAVSRYVASEQNIHNLLAVVAIGVAIICNWIVYQNGSIAFVLLGCISLIFIILTMPKRFIWPISLLFIASAWLNLNHLTIGVIHSEIDVRTLYSLICLIWPLYSLVTAEQMDERVKTKAVKQALVAIAAVQFLFYFIFPSWGVNNLVNSALCLAILVAIRKYSVIDRNVKYALVALSIGSYAYNLVYANGLTFYVVSSHLLFFYLLLPRFWASMLTLCYVVLAVLMLSLNDAMVIRGVLSALFVAYLFNTLMRPDGAGDSEKAKSNSLSYKAMGVASLISLVSMLVLEIPYILSGNLWWKSDNTPIFIFSQLFVFFVFSIFVYQLVLFIKEKQDESNQLIQSLQQSRDQLDRVTERAGISLVTFVPETGQYSVSGAYRQMFELPEDQFPEVSLELEMSRYSEHDRARLMAEIKSALSGHPKAITGVELSLPSGKQRVVDIRPSLSVNEGQHSLSAIFIDQTDIVQANLQNQRLTQELKNKVRETELALSAGNISIFEIDIEDKTATAFSGHHPIINIGDSVNLLDFTSKTAVDKQGVDSIVEAITSEQSHLVIPVHIPGTVGINYLQLVTGTYYEKEGRTKLLLIRSDVTEQQQALKVIQESKEKQRELFAVVGHELRTPVAAIDMLINDDMADEEKLAAIKEITSNLLSVLEDMRTVVAPERAKQSSLAFADPTTVIKRAVSPLAPLIKEKGLDLSLSLAELGGQLYHFAEQPLRQLVTNLTKNAAVHSEGSKIYIHSESKTIDGEDYLTLSVEDDGKGIPSHFVKSAFEPFSRGDSKADGTGLGLYIASELARELGGELNYTQSDLGGACFTFSCVMRKANPEAQAQAQVTLSGVKILFAEDEAMLRMLSEKMLTKQGAIVTCFENGQKALNGFDDASFDLVLTDLMMPELDGHGLVKAIRATGSQIPIIAVTAAVVGDETDSILAYGADAFISKPINPEKLKKVLGEIRFNRQ